MDEVAIETLAPRWSALLDTAEPGIDRWCSSFAWARSVQQAFAPETTTVLGLGGTTAAAFARYPLEKDHHALVPLDVVWSFGASVLGVTSPDDAEELAAFVRDEGAAAVFLGGLPADGPAWSALVPALGRRQRVFLGEPCVRCRASLDGGLDAYLARRSREFRRNLRNLERRLARTPVAIEVLDRVDASTVMARLQAIEARSWKGREGSGITSPEMSLLYRFVSRELAALGALRVAVAVDADGHDLAFVLGGVLGSTYRGLQLSFVEAARSLGLGNWLQWHELQRLCRDEPHVTTYDLGMDMAYKRTWAEQLHTTQTLIASR